MSTTKKSRFGGKGAIKREQGGAGTSHAERERLRVGEHSEGMQARRGFLGNGLSRTAMLFKIATVAGHRLTVPELNRIKDVNPRSLERVYDHIANGGGSSGDALFALRLILK